MGRRTPDTVAGAQLWVFLLLSILTTTAVAFAPSGSSISKIQRAAAVLVETSAAQSPAFSAAQKASIRWGRLQFKNKKATTVLDATIVESELTVTNSSAINANSVMINSQPDKVLDGEIQSTIVSMAGTIEMTEQDAKLLKEMEAQAAAIVDEMMDETCEVEPTTGGPLDELCLDEEKSKGFRTTLKGYVQSISTLLKSSSTDDAAVAPGVPRKRLTGDELEKGCE